MNKNTKSMSKDQLVEMITNITKQVIKESVFSDPEVGADDYEEQQGILNGPEGDGMPMDNIDDPLNDTLGDNSDEAFYDDFLTNPATEAFPGDNDEMSNGEAFPGDDDNFDTLLENKAKEELIEKQNKLFKFITENWDNHANNLIK